LAKIYNSGYHDEEKGMALKVLIEASGSLTSGYIIKAVQQAGHICVASDVVDSCFGKYLCDDFIVMPKKDDPALWEFIEKILKEKKIDVVIPSLDETLLGWSERRDYFKKFGVIVIISEKETVSICQDKWLTYRFLQKHGIPVPKTSLIQEYPFIKPRFGRGSKGIKVTREPVDMKDMISQEIIEGVEYTVDVFCDRNSMPVYIVPRKRMNVRDGKSTEGIVEKKSTIDSWVKIICQQLRFIGPINLQCFVQHDGKVTFVEINPRIAGGMALGFAATENWVSVAIENIVYGREIVAKEIKYGMEMKRYYAEVFIPPSQMG